MSDRLTPEWTATLDEAFGANGLKGLEGEKFVAKTLTSWGWTVEHHESDKDKQLAGVDISFQNPKWQNAYTADVKANIDQYGTFYVECTEDGWLFNPNKTSHRIWHCNPATGWMAWYDRTAMKNHIESVDLRGSDLYKVTVKASIDFIKRRKANKSEE